jgi:hypothetical protein
VVKTQHKSLCCGFFKLTDYEASVVAVFICLGFRPPKSNKPCLTMSLPTPKAEWEGPEETMSLGQGASASMSNPGHSAGPDKTSAWDPPRGLQRHRHQLERAGDIHPWWARGGAVGLDGVGLSRPLGSPGPGPREPRFPGPTHNP